MRQTKCIINEEARHHLLFAKNPLWIQHAAVGTYASVVALSTLQIMLKYIWTIPRRCNGRRYYSDLIFGIVSQPLLKKINTSPGKSPAKFIAPTGENCFVPSELNARTPHPPECPTKLLHPRPTRLTRSRCTRTPAHPRCTHTPAHPHIYPQTPLDHTITFIRGCGARRTRAARGNRNTSKIVEPRETGVRGEGRGCSRGFRSPDLWSVENSLRATVCFNRIDQNQFTEVV